MKTYKSLALMVSIISPTVFAGCNLPDTLANKNMLTENVQAYSPDNPMAGDVYNMFFYDNGKYTYTSLKDNMKYEGKYSYKKLSDGVAIISATSTYDNEDVNYSMTLVCNGDYHGSYTYQQSEGYGGVRTNLSRYFILQK